MRVPFNYLPQQFADVDDIIATWRELIASTDFTLGRYVEAFENKFAGFVGSKHCVAVNCGTDALILALRAVGVGHGDEVITVANTFYATVGAIVAVGGRPVLVDCDERMQIAADQVEAAITPRTRAIVPVHFAGASPDMAALRGIAGRHAIPLLEDACPGIGTYMGGSHAGTIGEIGTFSMHPIKTLNVMGDGGMAVTNDDRLARWMRQYRNHGMADRDHIDFWGVNMRLQPLQAVVASRVLDTLPEALRIRRRNAAWLDEGLRYLADRVVVPRRLTENCESYTIYAAFFKDRDGLLQRLRLRGIDAMIHYPIPLHLQKAAATLGYKPGDFPISERQAKQIMTLPCHQYITADQVQYMLQCVREYYRGAPIRNSA
jgi:aminotransferase EvaB